MGHGRARRTQADDRARAKVLKVPARRRPTGTATGPGSTAPLTERILRGMPGRRLGWVMAWALTPWLNLVVVLMNDRLGWTEPIDLKVEVVNRLAVSFAIVVSLWGAARISGELARLRPALTEVVEQDRPAVALLFRGIDSVVVPLLLTAAIGLLLPADELLAGEWVAGVIQGVTWLVIGIPMATAVWVYATLQLGLDRLGRGHVTLLGYRGDTTLGLEPVGRLAFTGFWMLLGALTPLVLASVSDLPSVIVGTLVIAASVVLFFLSVRGLHRQMAAVKRDELTRARGLYQHAYQRVQQDPTPVVLQQQIGLMNAAESLEKRAERIQAWPFDEATFARTITIASSAVATIIARILLAPAGL